jgi:hypothetical protein
MLESIGNMGVQLQATYKPTSIQFTLLTTLLSYDTMGQKEVDYGTI